MKESNVPGRGAVIWVGRRPTAFSLKLRAEESAREKGIRMEMKEQIGY